jgi:glucose-1-phosphate adenylyltransferase
MSSAVAIVLAGGKGERLQPLTEDRAKPAVPFGGVYRLIDFTLSNCVHSGIRRIFVMTQYKSMSLHRHLQRGWNGFNPRWGEFLEVLPPQQRMGERWYAGTADAVYQNIDALERVGDEYTLILAGDHVYKMDYQELLREHIDSGADVTVGCLPVPIMQGSSFGIMRVDDSDRITQFDEKPRRPQSLPDDPNYCLASMGIYVFPTWLLLKMLRHDAAELNSSHDFGRNLIPHLVQNYDVRAHAFNDPDSGRPAYWRDVGTIDAYFEANMDLKNVVPSLNLYNWDWPIVTANYPDPPAKLVFDDDTRRGVALQSVLSGGCIVAGGFVKDSVLGRNVFIDAGARVEASVLFDNVYVGRGARVSKAIIDKNVRIPEGDHIGHDLARDAIRYTVSEGGVTVVQKAKDTLLTRSRNF